MHCAVEGGSLEVLQLVVDACVTKKLLSRMITMCDDRGATPLHLAAKGPALMGLLLPYADNLGHGAFGLATAEKDDEDRTFWTARRKKKYEEEQRAKKAKMPGVMHVAAAEGEEAVVRLLLSTLKVQKGTESETTDSLDLKAKDGDGRTAVCVASMEGRVGVVKALMEADCGESANVGDHDGSTAVHWAYLMEHKQLGDWMCEHGGKDDTEDNDGRTPAQCREDSIRSNCGNTVVNCKRDYCAFFGSDDEGEVAKGVVTASVSIIAIEDAPAPAPAVAPAPAAAPGPGPTSPSDPPSAPSPAPSPAPAPSSAPTPAPVPTPTPTPAPTPSPAANSVSISALPPAAPPSASNSQATTSSATIRHGILSRLAEAREDLDKESSN